MRGLKRGIIFVFVLLAFSFSVSAIDDLISLQGNVQQGTANLASGNLTVYIYDAIAGGNLVWNSTLDSTGQYNNSIVSGKYDVTLGNSSTNVLNLEYGQLYYVEMYVNSEKFSFGGSDRQILQSSVGQINASFINPGQINVTHLNGNITFSYITGGENVVFSNTSTTFTNGNNLTLGVGGWFKGLFNWVIDSSSAYLTFNGTTLTFNEAQLNTTIDSRTADDISSTIANNTYRKLDSNLFNQQLNTTDIVYFSQLNASQLFANGVNVSQWLFNQSNIAFNYNQTAPANVYTDSATANLISSTIGNNTYMLIDKNVFDQQLNTTSGVLFSELNVTNVLRVGTTLLQADNTGTLNISGTTNFNNGWQSGGVSISGGSIYVQTLYAVNITSLGVSDLEINGTILPDNLFNNTFDIGNTSLVWRDGYFGREIYISGVAVSPWLFNQSNIAFNYNQTAPANVYSDARFLSNFQTSFNSNITPLDLVNSVQGNLSYANIQWNYNQTIMRNIFNQDLNKSSKVVFEEFNVTNASGSVGLYQGQNTYVGIGTASPATPLQIFNSGVSTTLGQLSNNLRLENTQNTVVDAGNEISFKGAGTDLNTAIYGAISAPLTAAGSGGSEGYISFSTKTKGATALTEAMRITSAGKVGIGTKSPGQPLEIASGAPTIRFNETDQAVPWDLTMSGGVIYFKDTGTSGRKVNFRDGSNVDVLTIDTGNEKVGIGTSSPTAPLEVGTYFNITTTAIRFGSQGFPFQPLTSGSTQGLAIGFPNTNVGRLAVLGNLSADFFLISNNATTNAKVFSLENNNNFVHFAKRADAGATTKIMSIDLINSRLGIGTATPTQKLDVAGNVNISTLGGNISLGGGRIYWDNPNSRLVIKVS